MKKLSTLLLSVVLFSAALPAMAATNSTPDDAAIQARLDAMNRAVNENHPQVWLQADQYEKDLQVVMKLNDISREDAISTIARGLMSQTGNVPKPDFIPREYRPTYSPRLHQYQQIGQGFYAGVNANGSHVFTSTIRGTLSDGFRYCAKGLTWTYGETASVCK